MSDDALPTLTSNTSDRVQKPNGSLGASVGAASGAAAPTPNPRSCVTCRRRKVKCDKKNPCSNCLRAKIECVFPGPGRAPRKSRKLPDGELMDRLRRLEGVVQSLNAQVEEHEQEAAERDKESRSDSQSGCPYERGEEQKGASVAADNSVEGLENRFGRLVVDQGRSRYINNSFWASLNNEVEDLKAILIEPSDDEDEPNGSPDTSYSSQHQSFLFGYSSSNVDMLSLHPPPERARHFWAIFKENVDPLIKVLHIPSIDNTIQNALSQTDKIPKALEALIFAIYYGAITSLMPEECMERWGEERDALLQKYRFGLEQALARANFLFSDEIVNLQAFVIFLILLRRNDDARKIWTLTGLAVRISQTLGIHRDGTHFNLKPFEVEMRRRLWWQVCILDARASEDHGCDPTIVEAQFDAKMPLNVNDCDLDPDMKSLPEEHRGFTDMTFSLVRFEVANMFRRMIYVPPGPNKCTQFFANLTISEKEKWISDCHARLEDKYLKDCDMSVPLYWVSATLSRLVMSKMWLIIYHPHQRRDGGASLPQETKDKLFITSLENIEYSILLETEARTMKWGWLFRTYVQWHAIAFLLSELCTRTKGEAVDRAWRALEVTAGRWWSPLNGESSYRKSKQGCLWKPLRKLMAKARSARERELALERASQALKNGGSSAEGVLLHPGLGPMPEQFHEPAPINMAQQPSPKSLDKLLNPSAPRLGEIPSAKPPSWSGSPSIRDISSPFSNGMTDMPEHMHSTAQGNGNTDNLNFSPGNISNIAQDFASLSNYGMDYLMGDLMQGMTYEGELISEPRQTALNDQTQEQQTAQQQSQMNGQSPTANGNPLSNNASTAMNDMSLFPPSPDTLTNSNTNPAFPNTATTNDSPDAITATNGTQDSDSPNVDGGGMNWESWDDLVSQYALAGQPAPANGATYLGMMNWF